MDSKENIEKPIAETKAKLHSLEAERKVTLKQLKQLQVKKQQLVKHHASTDSPKPEVTNVSSQTDKISLFRSLFKGREDVFPKRYESVKTGKSGYQPSCQNEWVKGICEKPQIKCADCSDRIFVPVSDGVIESHLKGCDIYSHSKKDYTVGVYPILTD